MEKRKLALHTQSAFFFTYEEWESIDLTSDDRTVLIGTPSNCIIRPGTKNLIEAPEKSFKTTMLLRLALGLAGGHTVYPSLPVYRSAKVLYIHGELLPQELCERRAQAAASLPESALKLVRKNFIDGQSLNAHLIRTEGQQDIRSWVKRFNPEVLILDPWQSFIQGYDENSYKDISIAQDFLNKLVVECNGLTVLIPIHLGKDPTRGARGHSSLSGWRDTVIRLIRKDQRTISVEVKPRWAPPVEPFKLTFQDGTMFETVMRPQTQTIRRTVAAYHKSWVPRSIIEAAIGGKGDSTRKAIQRALEDEAIVQNPKDSNLFGIPWEPDEFTSD